MEIKSGFKVGYGSIRECATELKVSRQRVHQLMNQGRLGECIQEDTPRGMVWYVPKPYTIKQGITLSGRPKVKR